MKERPSSVLRKFGKGSRWFVVPPRTPCSSMMAAPITLISLGMLRITYRKPINEKRPYPLYSWKARRDVHAPADTGLAGLNTSLLCPPQS